MEVKKRIGYLPETPPVYPEMEVHEYLDFVGRIKGVPKTELAKRVAEVSEKCAIFDVSQTLIGKLSKGYKQRVGLAQAIIHNPDVLILDEPTAGLDPHQIIETRDLIKGLAARGEHTIILSTHILPEVEQTCERVIIIAKGKLVATDTVANLTSRLRGAETVDVEVVGDGAIDPALVQRKLEQVAGVSRVLPKEHRDGKLHYMVESLEGRQIRPGLARAVVESGWSLNELHAVGLSLEEIFLQLTASPEDARQEEVIEEVAAAPAGEAK
jgi:ABC-2 type transport system ATP-binding protein